MGSIFKSDDLALLNDGGNIVLSEVWIGAGSVEFAAILQ